MKTHYKVTDIDAREQGQTEFEYHHQTACGFVRHNVTIRVSNVTCKLCLRLDDVGTIGLLQEGEKIINDKSRT